MPDRDRAAHHVDDVLIDLPAPLLEALQVGEHLRGERLVDLDQPQVLPRDAGPLQRPGHREHRRLQQLPPRIHRADRVGAHVGERLVPQGPGRLAAHQEHRRGAVREGRGVRGGDAAIAAVEHGLELGHLIERRVAPDAVVLRDDRVARTAREDRHDLRGEPAVGAALRGELMAAQGPAVWASREMRFSLAIFSADWPIVSPVEGSAIAGDTGIRSRGRIFANTLTRCRAVLALLASTRMSARRREARIGMSERLSTPPARITSAWPSTIWSYAAVTAWLAEAQARFRE